MAQPLNYTVSAKLFKALMNVDIAELSKMSAQEIRPILPSLVRMSLISANDTMPTKSCAEGRKDILTLLSGIELVNSIVALLSIEFHALEIDVKQEQLLRQKRGSLQSDSILLKSSQNLPPSLEFERSDSTSRLRLVLGELLYVSSQIHEQQQLSTEFYMKQSDLFDNAVYIPEICDVLSIAISELPALLTIQQVTEILLHVSYGPNIICCILANFPDCFHEVCKSLISNSDRLEEDNGGSKIRMQTMSMLCRMYPPGSYVARAQCVELCRMPALTLTLTLDYGRSCDDQDSDVVPFVTSLLLHSDAGVRNWFSAFLRSRQKKNRESSQALQALRQELLRHLSSLLPPPPPGAAPSPSPSPHLLPMRCVVQACALLRLYTALRCGANIKFQDEETGAIVRLMTAHPPPTPEGVRMVSLALCMLVACPSLIGHPEQEAKAVEWLTWLVKDETYLASKHGVAASFGELLLLMAIHFHGNQMNAISDLVSSTLGMKVTVRTNNLTRMKHIFTQEIFTEQVVTSHAAKVPVTENLNASMAGFLPIHCIYQLLKSRAFIKHKVPIKDWIYRQICASQPPLHPVLPSLVEVFVSSMLVPTPRPGSHLPDHMPTGQPITEQEIREVFSRSLTPRGPSLSCQLLLLYYMLTYEDLRLSSGVAPLARYTTEFLSDVPIKYLLQQAQRQQHHYAGLYAHLLRLLATHFPHLCLVDDWLEEEAGHSRTTITQQRVVDGIDKMTRAPGDTARMLSDLLRLPATDMWPYAQTVVASFRSTLDPCVPRYVQELWRQVWLRLNTVLPRCLWVMTVNAVRQQKTRVPAVTLTQESLVLDPLQVLRCDGRVFRSPPALVVLLRVLQACLAASRNKLSRHVLENAPKGDHAHAQPTDTEREELRRALVSTQESIAAQILLEVCLETPQDRQVPGQAWALREVRSIVCSYLHQVFISDPGLAKLVHFQGYPRELLQIAVEGIPSMHICTDFIPELLSQPCLDKQVFAIDLISHVSLQYALPKSMSCARLALNTLSTLLGVLPSHSRNELFGKVLPAFVRICEAFPPLVEDSVSLLSQLGRICVSEHALTANPAKLEAEPPSGRRKVEMNNQTLCGEIEKTFALIIQKSVLKTNIY